MGKNIVPMKGKREDQRDWDDEDRKKDKDRRLRQARKDKQQRSVDVD